MAPSNGKAAAERLPVVLYGATGYTGKLICEELERQQVPYLIAGRSREKLSALSARLTSRPPFEAVELGDRAGLLALASRGRVLLSAAGPFVKFGAPVRDAAIEAGAHFLDTTGEAEFLRDTQRCDAAARAKGVALVNAIGFDIVPTDAAAALAAKGLPDVATVRIAISMRGGRMSQGTARSLLGVVSGESAGFEDGQPTPRAVGFDEWAAPFASPPGTRRCLFVPLADLVAAPLSTGAKTVRTYFALPRLPLRSMTLPLALGLAGSGAGRLLLERLIQRLPEGPSPELRAMARFSVVAEAVSSAGQRCTARVTGGDGYDFSAASAVYCARRAADPSFDKRGFLTPSLAFGAEAILEALARIEVRWSVSQG